MDKIISQPLYLKTFERIKAEIRKGTYQKGDILPSERALMDTLGVSRVTIRQALKMLSDAGIISKVRGKGSIIRIDWKEMLDNTEFQKLADENWESFRQATGIRRMLEPMIAREAALKATESEIDLLSRVQTEQIGEEEAVRLAETFPANRRYLTSFHACLWSIADNPMLKPIWEILIPPSQLMRELQLKVPVDQELYHMESKRQHEMILRAVTNHNGEAAYSAMLLHCDWIYDVYHQHYMEFLH